MDEARKNAFRRILYAAMLDFRAQRTSMFSPNDRWKLWRCPGVTRRLQIVQVTADWLHNLAFFAAADFEGFEEAPFWNAYRHLVARFPELVDQFQTFRNAFEHQGPFDPGPADRVWGSADPSVPVGRS